MVKIHCTYSSPSSPQGNYLLNHNSQKKEYHCVRNGKISMEIVEAESSAETEEKLQHLDTEKGPWRQIKLKSVENKNSWSEALKFINFTWHSVTNTQAKLSGSEKNELEREPRLNLISPKYFPRNQGDKPSQVHNWPAGVNWNKKLQPRVWKSREET